jgi:6-phosphofructokinase 1
MRAGVVDVCLIPEVGFELEGEKGLFAYIASVLESRGHAVICLAEGAGQARLCAM